MVKEAKEDRYLVDGFWLRNFNQFPAGVEPENMLPVQREFIMYLCAAVPPVEGLRRWMDYSEEIREAENKDWAAEVDITSNEAILRVAADAKRVPQEQYLADWRNERAAELKKKAIDEIKESYGLKSEVESAADERQSILAKYQEAAKRLMSERPADVAAVLDRKPEGLK